MKFTENEIALLASGLNYNRLSDQLVDNFSNLDPRDILDRFTGSQASRLKAAGAVISSLVKKDVIEVDYDHCPRPEDVYYHYNENKLREVFVALHEAGHDVKVDVDEE